MTVITPDAVLDRHIDAVLRASGSALRYYSLHKTISDMRAAMQAAMREAAETERAECAMLCDSKTEARDHAGHLYYRPAPADACAAYIRARATGREEEPV